MRVTYKGKEYWVSYVGTYPSVYGQYRNHYGTEYERQVKRGSKTYEAVLIVAHEKKERNP